MASDFFERQDTARRNTTRLVVLFGLAVLALVVSVDLLLAATLGFLGRDPDSGAIDLSAAGTPEALLFATFATVAVVAGGSLYKIAQLRGGGHVVAEQLGGRRLNADTPDPAERRLLNVVEEMAIASGVPVPPVYLMEHEAGINAFAAGFTPNDAVIGVTQGTVDHLSRDELQGVIAHEFSHILNGDMRLNIRLIGLLNGILIIGMIGYFILRTAAFSGHGRRRGRQDGNPAAFLALGAGLTAIGFFGTFFGNLIKSGVSRQREFLADASAVQFTRQPSGLAGALKKIGGLAAGSSVSNPNAPEASHMFFGRATGGLSALFSTHPPLGERIRRVDPAWDGSFATLDQAAPTVRAEPLAAGGLAGFAGGEPARSSPATAETLVTRIGQPGSVHLDYAARLVGRLPQVVVNAAHEPYGARALVYALLLDRHQAARSSQMAHLDRAADPDVFREVVTLARYVDQLETTARLPLVDVTLPALRQLTAGQYDLFKRNLSALIQADATVDVFEWALRRILLTDLERHFGRTAAPRVRHRDLAGLSTQCEVLLSSLAHVGQDDPAAVRAAFEAGQRALNLPAARLRGPAECGLAALDAAVSALEEATPAVKRDVVRAAAACIAADRHVSAGEAELLRAMSASLGCPMPPLAA